MFFRQNFKKYSFKKSLLKRRAFRRMTNAIKVVKEIYEKNCIEKTYRKMQKIKNKVQDFLIEKTIENKI